MNNSSGSEPVSSLLPAVTAPGGSRPGPDKRGGRGATAGLIRGSAPVPPIREVRGQSLTADDEVGATRLAPAGTSPLVGEGVSGDFLGIAAGAGTAASPRRIKNELIRPIEGEGCWRCALPAAVVIIGSHGALWPYCEGHGIDKLAAEFLAQKYEARKGEQG
jgi:hypothetical protein